MKRYWVMQSDFSSDGIYSAKYCVDTLTKKIFKDNYIKIDNGLYYTSFDKETWIRIDSKFVLFS